MSEAQGLILAMYVGFALVLLLAGYIYKEVRSYRRRRNAPKLDFDTKRDSHNDAVRERVI
jgi:hypothetical protein